LAEKWKPIYRCVWKTALGCNRRQVCVLFNRNHGKFQTVRP
jgi:hypothetical protein